MIRTNLRIELAAACALACIVAGVPAGSVPRAEALQADGYSKRGPAPRAFAKARSVATAAEVPVEAGEAAASLRERGASVRMNAKTGRVGAAYGDLGEIAGSRSLKSVDVSDDEARSFILDHAALIGATNPDRDLELARRVTSPIGTHFYYQQKAGALDVFDGETAVHVDNTRHVRALTNSFDAQIDPTVADQRPVLDEAGAVDAAARALGTTVAGLDPDTRTHAELGVAPDGAGRLAYRVFVGTLEPVAVWEVFIDAATGEQIGDARPASSNLTGQAKVFVPNPVVSTNDTSLRDSGTMPDAAYVSVQLLDLQATGHLDSSFVSTVDTLNRVSSPNGNFSTLRRGDAGFNELEVYWAIETAQHYIQDTLGIHNGANYQIPVNAYYRPGGSDNYDNSQYVRNGNGTGYLQFGTGGVDDAQDAEVIWHEYGHAVMDNMRPNLFGDEAKAMGEGWGDYLCVTLSTTVPGDSRFYPTVFEWDATAYDSHNPPYLRRVDGTKQYPRDLVGEEHDDGEIWSSALWDLHNTLGRTVADPVIFNAMFLLPQDPSMLDGAAAIVSADQSLNGGANNGAIVAAFARHGINAAGKMPVVTNVRYKKSAAGTKLVVDGANFATADSVVEINGTALAQTKHPAKFATGGVSTRIVGSGPQLASTIPAGVPVTVTVFNPTTGTRSAPFQYTR